MEKTFSKIDPWDDIDSSYNSSKFSRQLKLIKQYAPKSLLEVGCSEGVFTQLLADYVQNINAIDVSDKAIIRAKLRCKDKRNVIFFCTDITVLKFSRQYDMILLAEVLSYVIWCNSLLEIGYLFERFIRSLRHNGKIVIVNTIQQKDIITNKDIIEYYPWTRNAYYSILETLGMKRIYYKTYSGIKNEQKRKYEIVVYGK
ncbi:MAG: SAM-dependent methyltransferase [Candidatus Daviesbacteria bacterium]|nr:SAM-dependent methyltransferase [Candidatus Daviesbacteria bacterium]